MATIDVTVTDLTFPEKLEDKYCKFRPLISIRYRDSSNKIMYAREALPGLGKRDYWECEKGNKNKPDYVRDDAGHRVDMDKLDPSKRQVTFSDLDVKKLETVIVEVFDIDIKSGFWDKLRENILTIAPPLAASFIPATLPLTLTVIKGAIEQSTGTTVSDLQKGLIDKAMGKEDGVARSLWTRSSPLTDDPGQTLTLSGAGIQGDYSVTLELQVS